jgi:nitrate reductase alpha subunit
VALLLGVCRILFEEKKYDEKFVRRFTDLPLLVRMDTGKFLKPTEVISGYRNADLRGYSINTQKITPDRRKQWGDFCVWDEDKNAPAAISRDDVGKFFDDKGVKSALEGTWTVKTTDGKKVEVKTVFQTYKELCSEYTLEMVEELASTPKELIKRLANDIATIKPVMIHTGEGINHYFHCDITTRAVFLPLALTGNVGKSGGNVGHWAGNYKSSVFPGVGVYIYEDPFAVDQGKIKKGMKPENICYWNYEDRPLIVNSPKYGRVSLTGKSHMPTPTKMIWAANVNLLNNAKWAYNMIANVDPKIEVIAYNEIEWTGSCEYADIVFPAQSWMECQQMNFTGSCANPFIQVWKGGIKPVYDSRPDGVIVGGVAAKLSEITGDKRYRAYFRHFLEDKPEVYAQRIFDASPTTKGYNVEKLLKSDRGWLAMFRTMPRIPGWEQIHESKPFYNKTGRLEFYRDEDEFLRLGENLIVHREPVEATPYLPNVIVADHPIIKPDDYGFKVDDPSSDARQVRNVKMPWNQVKDTVSPLWKEGFKFYCLTPKTRHCVHSSWGSVDWNIIWDSNFGDPYRADKRTPAVGEHQIHLNPDDAKELGLKNGDYVYVDANPEDRPYKGWKKDDPFYKVSRLMIRVKYNLAYPRGVTMMKHSTWMATAKTVKAHETRPDGRALAKDTGYQATLRYGSQQSLTRGWLQPSQMTDSLVRKNIYGHDIKEGYEPDINSPNTCPKETLVRITKAEDGNWKPAESGRTPGNVSPAMNNYINGGFVKT